MILFLDFDGVLHPFPKPEDPAQLFVNLDRLERVLCDHPDIKVVISSTWRETYSLNALQLPFSPALRSRIIDMLPVIPILGVSDIEAIRFKEIQLFLAGRTEPWLALDDDANLFPASSRANLILCENGFGAAEETKLRAALAAFKGNFE